MKRWVLPAVLGFLVLVVAIQFIPVETTNPPVEGDIPTSPAVKAVLRRACYDCHSHETVWPWYSRVAPLSWLLASDVREARAELNFSTWDRSSTQEQVKKLQESWKEVSEREMPPWYYLLVHREARLSAEDRRLLERWGRTPTAGTLSP
jgi:Haem-binding domain